VPAEKSIRPRFPPDRQAPARSENRTIAERHVVQGWTSGTSVREEGCLGIGFVGLALTRMCTLRIRLEHHRRRGRMNQRHRHLLAEARENPRMALYVRDAAVERGDAAVADREGRLIGAMEERLRELERAQGSAREEPAGGVS
jgi:hypothetical protein